MRLDILEILFENNFIFILKNKFYLHKRLKKYRLIKNTSLKIKFIIKK